MPTLNVKNGSKASMAFRTKSGLEVIKAGQSGTVKDARPVSDEKVKYLAGLGCEVEVAKPAKAKSKPEGDSK